MRQLVPSEYTGTVLPLLPAIVAPKLPVATRFASVQNALEPAPAVTALPNKDNVVATVFTEPNACTCRDE